MRVSELTKHNTVQSNIDKTSEKLQDLLINVSNGKALNKPSDDPVGAAKVQDFHTSINHSKSLQKNISANKVWLSTSEETISQIVDILMHVKGLALEGANGASTYEHRESLAKEIELITKDLIDLGNKKEGRLYVFAGTKTLTQPLEMSPQIKEAKVKFLGTRIKSTEKVIPLNQDKPLPGLKPGSFTITFTDRLAVDPEENQGNAHPYSDYTWGSEEDIEEGKPIPNQITVNLTGMESINEIVEKINTAAMLEQEYIEDPHSKSGYKAKILAEMGNDNSIYLDPGSNVSLKFTDDTTGFFEAMKFGILGDPTGYTISGDNDELPVLSDQTLDASEFEAQFDGYSKRKYLIRVIKGGGFGVAQYSVSDDGGETWSKAALLQKQNEIFNPEGKASNKVKLQFNTAMIPYFREGLEFQFDGNEFVTYNGNEQIKDVLIDNGIKVALNINAKQIFYEEPDNANTVNIFDMMNRLKEALRDDDELSVQKSIDDVQLAIDQVLDKQSQIGSTFIEMDSSEDRIDSNIDFKSSELSKLEDLDLAKGAVDLNNAELKHKVSLDSAARLIQPTLINFLK
jgi:flagellar hook-associated protein 3 FlgL